MNPQAPSTQEIITLHDLCIAQWKSQQSPSQYHHFNSLVEQNHSWNFQLWLAEDCARRDDKGFEFVYHAKRAIDQYNQKRNNLMEQMDEWLYQNLSPSHELSCPIHSETPGMMIDRLSIMALKIYHMRLQTERQDVDFNHQKTCTDKLNVLHAQRKQLAQCLENFFDEIINKKRTFKVYHQFKMYNDPTLNPELYSPK